MRSLILAAAAALAFATCAGAQPRVAHAPPGPYHLEANGSCHGSNGQLAPTSLCGPFKVDGHGRCHGPSGQIVPWVDCKR